MQIYMFPTIYKQRSVKEIIFKKIIQLEESIKIVLARPSSSDEETTIVEYLQTDEEDKDGVLMFLNQSYRHSHVSSSRHPKIP